MMTETAFALINSSRRPARTRTRVGEMLIEVDRLSAQAQKAAFCNFPSDILWRELTHRASTTWDHAKTFCDLAGISFEELLAGHVRQKLRRTKMTLLSLNWKGDDHSRQKTTRRLPSSATTRLRPSGPITKSIQTGSPVLPSAQRMVALWTARAISTSLTGTRQDASRS